MFFSDVIGQEKVKSHLIQSVRDQKVSHAQLFTGDEGYGGLPLAVAFSQYILCENREKTEPCGVCPSCLQMQKLIHPDLHFVFPVVSGKSIKKPISDDFIEIWRNAFLEDPYMSASKWLGKLGVDNKQGLIYTQESNSILRKLNLKSFESEFKIMIIWQPERMHNSCSNKLLKIIEEPPPKTIFLLVSKEPAQLLPTILSRVQMIRLSPINDNTLITYFREESGRGEKEVRNFVCLAEGSYTRAKEIIEAEEDLHFNLDKFKNWMRLCYSKNIPGLIEWVEGFSREGREKNKSFLTYSLEMMRENFLLNVFPEHQKKLVRLTDEENTFSEKFSSFIKEGNINSFSKLINGAIIDIRMNAYTKTVMLDLSLKVSQLIRP